MQIDYELDVAGTFVHTVTFESIENKAYQGALEVRHISPTLTTDVFDIKVEAFGQVVVL